MASVEEDADEWMPPTFRIDEELKYFTDLAFQETERWISAVTQTHLSHENLRKSLENGVALCQLLNALKPGSVKRINKLNTPIAGLDNISVFLKTCQQNFGLSPDKLFDLTDLEDLSLRAVAESNPEYITTETDRRLLNVVITIYWIARVVDEDYTGPGLDYAAFAGLISRNVSDPPLQSVTSLRGGASLSKSDTYNTHNMNQHSRQSSSNRSCDSNRYSGSAFSDSADDWKHSSSDISHTRSSSGDSTELLNSRSSYSQISADKRKSASTSSDPLQFVKAGPRYSLAETAKEQMQQVSEVKHKPLSNDDGQDVEWKSNLSNWRNRRRKMSASSLATKERLEAEYEKEDEQLARRTKTFTEIVKDREKRISSYNAYPIDDDDIFGQEPIDKSKPLSRAQVYIDERLNEKNTDSIGDTGKSQDKDIHNRVTPRLEHDAELKAVNKTKRRQYSSYPIDNEEDVNENINNISRLDINKCVKDDFDVHKSEPSRDDKNLRRKSEYSIFERKFGAKEVLADEKSVPKLQSQTKSKPGRVSDILKSFKKFDAENNNNNNDTGTPKLGKSDVNTSRSNYAKSRDSYKSLPKKKKVPTATLR